MVTLESASPRQAARTTLIGGISGRAMSEALNGPKALDQGRLTWSSGRIPRGEGRPRPEIDEPADRGIASEQSLESGRSFRSPGRGGAGACGLRPGYCPRGRLRRPDRDAEFAD